MLMCVYVIVQELMGILKERSDRDRLGYELNSVISMPPPSNVEQFFSPLVKGGWGGSKCLTPTTGMIQIFTYLTTDS